MVILYSKFALALLLVFSAVLFAPLIVPRADLPPLLYSVEDELHLMHIGCEPLAAGCRFADRILLDGLHATQGVAQWSPDGATIAAHFENGWRMFESACLLDAARESACRWRMLDETPHGTPGLRLAWSADGAMIAYLTFSGTQVKLRASGCWLPDSADECHEWSLPAAPGLVLTQAAWGSDELIFTGMPDGLYRLSFDCFASPADCRAYFTPFNFGGRQFLAPTLAPDGRRLIVDTQTTYTYRQIALIDLPTHTMQFLTPPTTDSILPHVSSDGRYIAYSGLDRNAAIDNLNLYVYDLARGLRARATTRPGNELYSSWGVQPILSKAE